MPTHHLASWLLKHSDVPLTVLKPVATKVGVSTNHLGAALFAGQIIYENQGAIVKYADRGGVRVGQFLHARAVERYGEDHAVTRYLDENVAALDEAFEGSEEEAVTFAEFYRQLRAIDRDTPDLSGEDLLSAAKDRADDARKEAADARESAPDGRDLVSDAKRAVGGGAKSAATGARDAVDGAKDAMDGARDAVGNVAESAGDSGGVVASATGAVGDRTERLRDLRPGSESATDSETDAVEIPVRDEE
ncbi:hypothetical protein M0R89_15865 [Halorussus limi]|uniref:Uncharacterized protein n=1 Tax=Halorussus limi TaxID=2938695 RepID=A0A8U0HT68_9EURY|nr:hypothetical protein [Halorussus limi]UPV74001.1 hypothetical protein M0R89_15865 [Halorussus limi]